MLLLTLPLHPLHEAQRVRVQLRLRRQLIADLRRPTPTQPVQQDRHEVFRGRAELAGRCGWVVLVWIGSSADTHDRGDPVNGFIGIYFG